MKKELVGDRKTLQVDKSALTQGSLVSLKSLPFGLTKQDIKIALLHITVPSYVDYQQGSLEATVRFPSQEEADRFVGRNVQFTVKDCPVHMSKFTPEQENEYFRKVRSKRERFVKEKTELKKKNIQKAIIEQKQKSHKKRDVKNRAAVLSNKKQLSVANN